jgi:hypothetical protein
MAEAVRLAGVEIERLGEDLLVSGYPVWEQRDVINRSGASAYVYRNH